MITNVRKWLLGATLAGAAAVSIVAWADGPPPGMDRDPTRMIARLGERLELTAEQKAQANELVAGARAAGATDRERMVELHTLMMAQRTDFDAVKAQAIADEIGQLTARMVYQASATWSQFYQLLTTEQRAELDKMMAQREARGGKLRKTGGPAPE